MSDDFREFDCTDCGCHIVAFGPDTMGYCATCLAFPGWYNDPVLRERFDPDGTTGPEHCR